MTAVAEIIAIVERLPEREQFAFMETVKLVRDDPARTRLLREAIDSGCRDFASVFEYVYDHA